MLPLVAPSPGRHRHHRHKRVAFALPFIHTLIRGLKPAFSSPFPLPVMTAHSRPTLRALAKRIHHPCCIDTHTDHETTHGTQARVPPS